MSIADRFQIVLEQVGVKWRWSVIGDDDRGIVEEGSSGDYEIACRNALIAHDDAVKESERP